MDVTFIDLITVLGLASIEISKKIFSTYLEFSGIFMLLFFLSFCGLYSTWIIDHGDIEYPTLVVPYLVFHSFVLAFLLTGVPVLFCFGG